MNKKKIKYILGGIALLLIPVVGGILYLTRKPKPAGTAGTSTGVPFIDPTHGTKEEQDMAHQVTSGRG